MKRLKELSKRLKKIDEGFFIRHLFADKAFKDLIIRLNTEDQLYNQGIDSLGRELGNYSPVTLDIKIEKGQRYDHITLNDTGEFYNSWRVQKTPTGFLIKANGLKDDGTDLIKVWGKEILGLTEENMQRVIDAARLIVIPKMREQILKRAA